MKRLYYISKYTAIFLLLVALFCPVKGNAVINYYDFATSDTIPNKQDSLKAITASPSKFQRVGKTANDTSEEETKKEKPKTLDTYAFTDSAVKARHVFVWHTNTYFNEITLTKLDTLISENRTELPFYKKDVGATYLGTTGSATLPHNYFKRNTTSFFSFLEPYSDYIKTPDEVVFYNTKTPFSDLGYFTSGSKRVSEDNLKVLFTANISPAWNFGISYQRFGSRGIYQNQATNDKSFTAFSSYIGKRYVAHAGYIYNAITNKENGGIKNDYDFVDTIMDAGAIDVKLKTAQNKLRNNTFFLTHTYGLPIELLNKHRDSTSLNDGGAMVYFGHSFEYSHYNRVYTDGYQDTINHYYDKYYLSKVSSVDSSFASQLNNKAFLRLQPWSSNSWISKVDGGVGYTFDKFYTFSLGDYLYQGKNDNLSTGYIYGGASGVFKKYFEWNAFFKYNFSGYLQNDLLFDAQAKASIYPLPKGVHLIGRFTFHNRQPSYFNQRYFSNHAVWDNNFDKIQDTKIQLSLSIPDWDMEAGFDNALVNKPIYYDYLNGLPKQSTDVHNITSIYLQKNFRLGILRLDHRILMQISSNKDIIPLPLLSGNISYYLESEWVKSVLNTQVGFDVYYNTKFYDYAYNPAVGMFHLQNEKELGGYPWIDLFLNMKWKRANIYIKMTNVAEGIVGNREYFSALHYPRNNRMFRMGIRWLFFS